jgi:dihydrofolate reductase
MNAIFAVNSSNGFGVGKTMPWPKNTADLKRFKKLTTGHTVVMGRATWESNIPHPFPNRRNCVISTSLNDDRCEVFRDIESFLSTVKPTEKVFVIGGQQLLWNFRPHINVVYLTKFNDTVIDSDVYLDVDEYLKDFELISGELIPGQRFGVYFRQ